MYGGVRFKEVFGATGSSWALSGGFAMQPHFVWRTPEGSVLKIFTLLPCLSPLLRLSGAHGTVSNDKNGSNSNNSRNGNIGNNSNISNNSDIIAKVVVITVKGL